jgi:aldehyde:ferredoxin oxidoreductase
MGSKKLKAIAIRGTKPIPVYDMEKLQHSTLDLYTKAQTTNTEKYRLLGTPANILVLNRLAALPTRNFQQASFEGAEAISGERLAECYLTKVTACATCPVACEHLYRVNDGPYSELEITLDYESLFALGSLCGVDSLPAILKAAQLCDFFGIDTISTGGSIAWAMECFEKGVLTQVNTDGLDLSFGNQQALVEMVAKIGNRNGLGDLLAQGTKRASAALGKGSEHWAIHAKGLELPGYDPRSMQTQGLGFAVGLRGGCHNRSPSYEVDMSPNVNRLQGEPGRGRLNMEKEDTAAILDSLIICKFLRRCFGDFLPETASLYTLATGIEITPVELKQVGERVNNLKKVFNIREGWTQADDWLAPRFFKDPIPSGEAKDAVISEAELKMMIDEYYKSRGWTESGLVKPEKLAELGMADIQDMVKW